MQISGVLFGNWSHLFKSSSFSPSHTYLKVDSGEADTDRDDTVFDTP